MSKWKTRLTKLQKLPISKNYTLSKGLSESEICMAEEIYEITFPPELKEMLMMFNPYQLYDWSDFSKTNIEIIKGSLSSPIRGVLFDVERNNFWINS